MAKNREKERPGVIVRFDAIPTLEKLSEAARGRFLMACLYYGQRLETVSFDDLELEDKIRVETLWEQTKPQIDSDAEGWKDGILQRKYAGYCSGCERSGEIPMTYDAFREWFQRKEELGV